MTAQSEIAPPNPATSDYPRVYKTSPGWKAFSLIGGSAFVAVSLLGMWYFADAKNLGAWLIMQGICLAFVLLGAVTIAEALRSRVVLTATTVEVQSLLKVRELKLADIAARRTVNVRNSPARILLVPLDRAGKVLTISKTIRVDRHFEEWLATIPDQDVLEQQKLEQDVATNPLYGSTPEERQLWLSKLRTLTRTLGMVGLGVTLWGLFYPYPYRWVIAALILCPLVGLAVAARSKGLIQINEDAHDKRPSVFGIMLSPAIVLALRALVDFNLVDWRPAVLGGLVGGVVFVLGLARVDPKAGRWPAWLLLLGVLAFPYAYGSIVALNAIFEREPVQVFESKVLEKHENTGRSHTWNVNVAAWGPVEDSREVSVSQEFYEHANVGDTVCIDLHKGAVGIRWYWLGRCPDDRP